MPIIHTIKGDFEETALVKSEGSLDNENETTTWVEYRLPGSDEVIHRSAHVILKRSSGILGEVAGLQ